LIEFSRDPSLAQPGLKSPQTSQKSTSKAYELQRSGDKFFAASRFGASKDFYQKSLDAYRKSGDKPGMAATLQRWGRSAELVGEYGQAGAAFQESLNLFEELSHLGGIARSKAHLGSLAWALGEYEKSLKFLDEALSLYKVGEDSAGEAWVLDLHANLRLSMRDDERAESLHQKAFEVVSALGVNLENLAWNDYHLGALAFFRSQISDARERFSAALKSFVKLRDDLGQVAALTHLGEIDCEQKDFSGSGKNLQRAVKLVLPTQCMPLLADVLTAVARLMKGLGEDRKAVSLLMVALSHPTCRQQTKDRMVNLTMGLNAHFSEAEAQKGFEWARAVNLADVAAAWASGFGNESKKKK